ncbi:hypothetical protein ScPMuIL_005505, partial [Solemya velum]
VTGFSRYVFVKPPGTIEIAEMGKKLLIDVDTGVDDAHALILALSQPEVEVLGITCVHGNVDLDQVCKNTLRVLKVCGKMNVPVYRGSAKPILGYQVNASHYHGKDGLGGKADMVEVDAGLVQSEPAVLAMLRLVNHYPGEITLVALAPLTNIALALKIDPDFGKKLKDLTVMGGNIEGRGNVTVSAEFNFGADPEAASIVLSEMKCKLSLMSWETNLQSCQPWEWAKKWLATDTQKGRFINAISQTIVTAQRQVVDRPFFRSCDLFTMATIVDPDVITETKDVHAVVELHGQITRGQMVVDWRGLLAQEPNVRLITKIDKDRARVLFEGMIL